MTSKASLGFAKVEEGGGEEEKRKKERREREEEKERENRREVIGGQNPSRKLRAGVQDSPEPGCRIA